MTDRNVEADLLALLEPCLICLRPVMGPNSGAEVWGTPGYHEGCLAAARRWYPEEAAEVSNAASGRSSRRLRRARREPAQR